MQEENQPTGNGIASDIPPCKFKVGDWVKMTTPASRQSRFSFMKKDDIGVVMDVKYTEKNGRRWFDPKRKYYLVTVYWQNSAHSKTGHQVRMKEKRLKFANRKRKQD